MLLAEQKSFEKPDLAVLETLIERRWLIVLHTADKDARHTAFFEHHGSLGDAKRMITRKVVDAEGRYLGYTIHIYDYVTGIAVASRRVGNRVWKPK